jgi:type III pantothenate kinase
MQLVIDIGNTRIKAAVFEKDELIERFTFDRADELLKKDLGKRFQLRHCIIGSVVDNIFLIRDELEKQMPVLIFNADTPTPVKNLYRSAHTLGSDRLAGAVGGNALAPAQDILVIDAGTCIKYNFVNSKNEYLGGAISPGLSMRFNAMHTFTDRLPLLSADDNFTGLIGGTSAESILSGAQNGAVYEMDGFIDQYSSQFNNLKVFLTGGDTEFFAKRLKNRIFADQNLILRGLNRILVHNLNI